VGYYQIKIGIVIPARLESKRLPGKVLTKFSGKPMIEHVWSRANLVLKNNNIIIATDNTKIAQTSKDFGAQVLLTKKNHQNGLSRIGEVSDKLKWDFYIVLQADELLIEPSSIVRLLKSINSKSDAFNIVTDLSEGDMQNRNVVKCTLARNKQIITFFRKNWYSTLNPSMFNITRKLCGLYAVSHDSLKLVTSYRNQNLEKYEKIEQFKFLELNQKIQAIEVANSYLSINTLKDASEAKKILSEDNLQKKILKLYS